MKHVLISVAICIVLMGCSKDHLPTVPLIIGQKYDVKSTVFRMGNLQPLNPVTLKSLYYSVATGSPRALVWAPIDWSRFDPNQPGNRGAVDSAFKVGDSTPQLWDIQQNELTN